MRVFATALSLSLALLVPVVADAAQSNGRGPNGGPPGQAEGNPGRGGNGTDAFGTGGIGMPSGGLFDSAAEILMREYFETHPIAPQGLPPGIARNLERGKPLPPGIAKRYLPADLRGRLPDYPGHEILIVDRDVLLVSIATGLIVDILTGIL